MKEKLNINLFKLPEHTRRQGQLETTHKGSHPAVLTHKLIEVSCGPSTNGASRKDHICQDFRLVSPDFVKVTAYNTFIMPMRMAVSPTGKK